MDTTSSVRSEELRESYKENFNSYHAALDKCVRVHVHVRVRVRVRVCARARAFMCACACVRVRICARESRGHMQAISSMGSKQQAARSS